MGYHGLVHLIFIAVFLSFLHNSYTEEYRRSNPSSPRDQGPSFTSPYVHLDYVRFGHYGEIKCYGQNYDSIDWYIFKNNKWEQFVPCNETCHDWEPAADKRGQVLSIKSIDSSSNTSFKCVLNKEGYSSIYRTTQIFVVRCDELARGPIATIQPINQDIFSFGIDVTFQCEGYFGCDEYEEKYIGWSIQDSSSGDLIMNQFDGTKLILQEYNKSDATILGVNLTVRDVESQDLGRKYICIMASPQVASPSSNFTVQINKKDPPIEEWKLILICVGVALGSAILIGVIVGIVWYCCGPQIKLRIRQALPDGFIGPKTLDNENYEYNAILYHADEDTQKAKKIKEGLEKEGWKIMISAEILGGRMILTESIKYCEKSALVMFLYTDNLRNDRLANIIFELIIDVKKNKKILVIEINNKIKKTFIEWFKSAKDRKKIEEQNDEVKNGGHDVEIEVDGEQEENREGQPEENLGLLQTDFWKGVSTIKWNKKHENKVLCQIQNKLPKLKFQVQMERRINMENNLGHNLSVGSQKPLLSQNRGSSAIVECSPPPINSPGSNSVFFGEEEEEVNNPEQNPENFNKCAHKFNVSGGDRVNADLVAEVHIDGHQKIPTAAETDDIFHIANPESDLTNQDLHNPQNCMEDQQTGQIPTTRAEYRAEAGAYGQSPANSGYGSMEASGSSSLENSNEHNRENYKENLGQHSSNKRQQTCQSPDEQSSSEGRRIVSQSSDESSSRRNKQLLSQSSGESGYAGSLSSNLLNTEYDSINKDIPCVNEFEEDEAAQLKA